MTGRRWRYQALCPRNETTTGNRDRPSLAEALADREPVEVIDSTERQGRELDGEELP